MNALLPGTGQKAFPNHVPQQIYLLVSARDSASSYPEFRTTLASELERRGIERCKGLTLDDSIADIDGPRGEPAHHAKAEIAFESRLDNASGGGTQRRPRLDDG